MKFYETLEKCKNKKINLYVDMDGVIAEYDIGNFDYQTIRPLKSNIKRIEELLKIENIHIKILTICKSNKIVEEKIEWIQKYMPFFNIEDVIFISKENSIYQGKSSKELKSEYVKDHMLENTVTIIMDDDNEIIKYIRQNNPEITVFQVSSWID